jgi:hypothetical protein
VDTYAGDALGRLFLANRDGVAWEAVTPAVDDVFLFEPVPVDKLYEAESFTMHPNGVVADYTIKHASSGMSTTSVDSFDDRGVLQQEKLSVTGRFGQPVVTTSTYNYAGVRLVSIDTVVTPAASGPPSHTDYLYDANGNNIERVMTGSNNDQHYVALFDAANNLVCDSMTIAGAPAFVRHYDYGCFPRP